MISSSAPWMASALAVVAVSAFLWGKRSGVAIGKAFAMRERDGLRVSVSRLERAVGNWLTRAQTAERRVNELFMEHCEDRARQERSFEIVSQRCKAIDEAKAKCGPDFTHIVGTEKDPVFLPRPDAVHDDYAWVSTLEEFAPRVVEGE